MRLDSSGMDIFAGGLGRVRRVVSRHARSRERQQSHLGDRPRPRTIRPRHEPVRRAQGLQRVSGAEVHQELRDVDTGVRPAKRHRPRQGPGLHRSTCSSMTEAPRGKPVHLPHRGRMRLLITVEDIAEVFARVLLADAAARPLQFGRIPVSLGELPTSCASSSPTRRSLSRRTAAARNPATTWWTTAVCARVRHRVPALATRVLVGPQRRAGERRR